MEKADASRETVMTRPPAIASPCPSDMVQAAVSVALAVYLIGLTLSIAGNSISGSSALVRTIKARLFAPWMQPAWLDLGFEHPLTSGFPEDANHTLEVRGRGSKGASLVFPGSRTGEQANRWRRLGRTIAVAGEEGAAPPMTAGVGAGSFDTVGETDVTVRVVRRPLPERSAPAADARPRPTHAARVRRVAGEIQVIELGGAAKQAELAPVLREPTLAEPPLPSDEVGDD